MAVIVQAPGGGGYILVPGTIATSDFQSGAITGTSETLVDTTFFANEYISGASIPVAVAAVNSTQNLSGSIYQYVQAAMASVSGRMPAIGIVTQNYAPGALVTMYRGGTLFNTNINFSGWLNQPVYVGRSGQICASGAPTSSGDVQQIIGVSVQNSGMIIQIGDPLEQVIAQSGDVGSGAVTGQAIASGGYYCIGSGTLNQYDLGSGYSAFANSDFYTAWGTISGFVAVSFTSGGSLQLAQPGSGLTLPAFGIAANATALSGATVQVFYGGLVGCASGLNSNFSGFAGKPLYIISGGAIGISSGVLQYSGMLVQRVGVATSGGMKISIDPQVTSGLIATAMGNF